MRKQSREVVFKMLFSYNFGQKDEPQTYDEMLDVILQDLGLDKQQLDLEYINTIRVGGKSYQSNFDTLK